jgi:hypothetical protein
MPPLGQCLRVRTHLLCAPDEDAKTRLVLFLYPVNLFLAFFLARLDFPSLAARFHLRRSIRAASSAAHRQKQHLNRHTVKHALHEALIGFVPFMLSRIQLDVTPATTCVDANILRTNPRASVFSSLSSFILHLLVLFSRTRRRRGSVLHHLQHLDCIIYQ